MVHCLAITIWNGDAPYRLGIDKYALESSVPAEAFRFCDHAFDAEDHGGAPQLFDFDCYGQCISRGRCNEEIQFHTHKRSADSSIDAEPKPIDIQSIYEPQLERFHTVTRDI